MSVHKFLKKINRDIEVSAKVWTTCEMLDENLPPISHMLWSL
jgi:hypothetical protein